MHHAKFKLTLKIYNAQPLTWRGAIHKQIIGSIREGVWPLERGERAQRFSGSAA